MIVKWEDTVSALRTVSHHLLLFGFLAGIFTVPLVIALEAAALSARRAFELLLHLSVCSERYCNPQQATTMSAASMMDCGGGGGVAVLGP